MSKNKELNAAAMRKAEIERKVKAQRLQSSGYVPSQHGAMTDRERLVGLGHYARTGTQLKTDRLQNEINRINKKIRAMKSKVVHVDKT